MSVDHEWITPVAPGPGWTRRRTAAEENSSALLFDCNPLPTWVIDLETWAFLEVNDAAVAHYGFSRAEFQQMTIADLHPAEDLPTLAKEVADFPVAPQTRICRHRKKDGSLISVELSATTFIFGGRSARLVVSQDVTRRQQLEELLLQAQKMQAIGCAAASVAHEIANPLAYASSNLFYVDEELASLPPATLGAQLSADLRSALKDARDGLERVNQIVCDLKGMARADDLRAPVDLRQVLESTARIALPIVKQRAQLVLEIGELAEIHGNSGKLGQVILNLLVNAAQAIPEGNARNNSVTLKASMGPGRAIVEVRDTGCGMSRAVLARLFEPFFTTKAKGVGTGLGLAICQGIVEGHGGTITVESEPGKGTLFRLDLPI